MIFWIFVIIGVLGLACGLICCGGFKAHRLEVKKDIAWDAYFATSPNYRSKESIEEYEKLRDAYHAADKEYNDYIRSRGVKDVIKNTGFGFAVGAGIVLFIMIIVLIISYAAAPGERATLEADYEVLSWEVENQVYQDGGDDVVGKKELYNQVREWNATLASNQCYEKNFWVGIFVPDIYGDLKPIELK